MAESLIDVPVDEDGLNGRNANLNRERELYCSKCCLEDGFVAGVYAKLAVASPPTYRGTRQALQMGVYVVAKFFGCEAKHVVVGRQDRLEGGVVRGIRR